MENTTESSGYSQLERQHRADARRLLRWAREARLAGTRHGREIAETYRRLARRHREWLRGETCAVCGRVIEPEARFFTATGQPRHMLCEDATRL